jgi:predicted dehydrogenase
MITKIRWGILGCGKIANKFASDLQLVDDAELVAIASRDTAKSKDFSEKFKPRYTLSTYDDLVTHPEVDVIYIATPHGFHYEHVMLCLKHRKAVLCEKAFALNAHQLHEMISLARREKVFLMEAFWTKFLPQFNKIKEVISSGTIGEIKLIQSDFGFAAPAPIAQRLWDPALGGGSLLDIGIYPVFLTQALLGKPSELTALMTSFDSGVDEQIVITMKFENKALAVLSSTFACDTPVEAMIAGTKGRIQMRNRFHNAIATIELVTGKDERTAIDVHRENGFGYQFEARHINDCLKNGLTESPIMSHQESLDLMETLDKIRKACGIRYPIDKA